MRFGALIGCLFGVVTLGNGPEKPHPNAGSPGSERQPPSVRFTGCVQRQTYDIRPSGSYSMAVWIKDGTGQVQEFAFGRNEVTRVTVGAPLVSTAATLHWTRIVEMLERGAAADRPVTIAYENNNHVFGVSVEWDGRCTRP